MASSPTSATTDDGLDLLLTPLGRDAFFDDYWERRPLVLRATPERRALFAVAEPADDSDVLALAAAASSSSQQPKQPRTTHYAPACDFAELVRRAADSNQPKLRWGLDVNAARAVPRQNGRAVERQTPNAGERGAPIDPKDLWRLFVPSDVSNNNNTNNKKNKDDHAYPCSFQLMQPQRWSDDLWRFAAALEAQFGALVGINSYITPPGAQGLAPHWDDVEVLVVQTRGAKKWHLRSLGRGDTGAPRRRQTGGGEEDKEEDEENSSSSSSDEGWASDDDDDDDDPFDARLSLPSTPSGDLPLADALKLGRFSAKALFAGKASAAAAAAGRGPATTTTTTTNQRGGADVDAETGLVTTVTLYPGDVLYMPRGTVHWAEAVGDDEEDDDKKRKQEPKAGSGGGGSSPSSSSSPSAALTHACAHHSAHLTISTYQRWTFGDLLMYLLDGTLHRPAGQAPPSEAQGGSGLPLALRRSPRAGFAFACGLEAPPKVGSNRDDGDLVRSDASAFLLGLERAIDALRRSLKEDRERRRFFGDEGRHGPAFAAGRRMAAADFWGFRLPPHPAQLWPKGPAPELDSRLAWRATRWATVLPVGSVGGGRAGHPPIKVVSCLDNRRESHMVPPAAPEQEEDEEGEDEGEDEDDEEASGSGSESGSEDDDDDEDDEDEDEDEDDESDDETAAEQDPSDPISALPGVIMPGRMIRPIRQLSKAAEDARPTPRAPWRAGAAPTSLLEAAAVPLRALKGLSDDHERLRLAYSLWCAGLVSVLGPSLKAEVKKEKEKEKTTAKTKKKGPIVGKRGLPPPPAVAAAAAAAAAANKKRRR